MVQHLVKSFSVDKSSSGVEQLQLLQPGEDKTGEVKDRHEGTNTGETEILEAWAEESNLKNVHFVELLQVEPF